MYTHYVGNFDKATETLSLWTKKSPPMAALIDEIQVSLNQIILFWRSTHPENTKKYLLINVFFLSFYFIFETENQRM